jgi:RHS repeat-associated protein
LTQAQSGAVATDLVYDSLSRTLSEQTGGRMVAYEHDDVGNATQLTYPSGHVVSRSFDPLNRPTEIGQSLAEGGIDPAVTYSYRGTGRLAGTTHANGVIGERQFDAVGRMLSDVRQPAAGGTAFGEGLSWDQRGLKAAQWREDLNSVGFAVGYDEAGRVERMARMTRPEETVPNNTSPEASALAAVPDRFDYAYDPVQNLLKQDEDDDGVAKKEVPLPPDASGRNRPASISGMSLGWDGNGNLMSKGDRHFKYDFRNRLTQVTDLAGNVLVAYTYDAFNRRIRTEVGGEVDEVVWAGDNEIEDYVDGQLTRRRTFGLGLDEVALFEADLDGDGTLEQQYVPFYDSTGSLTVMTDGAGKAVERYLYDSYGNRKVYVDLTPPEIEQVEVEGGAIVVQVSEEPQLSALGQGLGLGGLTVANLTTGVPPAPTVDLPVTRGRQQRTRFVLTPTVAPEVGDQIQLTVQTSALVDLFGNHAEAPYELTFAWPAAGGLVSSAAPREGQLAERSLERTILFDAAPPEVVQVLVRDSRLEVELSEEIDTDLAVSAFEIDGEAVAWERGLTPYKVITVDPIAEGHHVITLDQAVLETSFSPAGAGSASLRPRTGSPAPSQFEADFGPPPASFYFYSLPDDRQVPVSTLGNLFGYQGRPREPETGLLYLRNRWYDPELGRFLTPDPMGYTDGPSMYTGFGNNPVNNSDPLGLRQATPEDEEAMAALAHRITAFDWQYAENQSASARMLETGYELPHWWSLEKQRYTRWITRHATSEESYRKIRSQLQRDYDTYIAAVAEADPEGSIEYSPVTSTFYTITGQERWEELKRELIWLSPVYVGDTLTVVGSPVVGRGLAASLIEESWANSAIEFEPTGVPRAAAAADDLVDLTTPARRQHILEGDVTGGGHRPGTGIPGKSEFPAGWSDDRIIHSISDIATDPAAVRTAGRGGRTIVTGTRDGVEIRVVLEADGTVVTGYPTNVPRNP